MGSSFFEFHVAVTGLTTSRAGLEIVSHNSANAATKGYSRQIAQTRASTPLASYGGKGMIGTGSEVYSIIQVRDTYLDKKYWNAQPTLGEYATKRAELSLIETVFSELDGMGLTDMFNEFYDSLQDLITNSGDITYRTNVIASAGSMTTYIKNIYESLIKQQDDINEEVRFIVSTINNIGLQIKVLNEKIRVFELDGSNANDLRDQRALLVDELSQYVNIDAYETDNGDGDKRYYVKINGQDFVSNNNLRTLTCRERSALSDDGSYAIDGYRNAEDTAGLFDIYWGDSETKFNVYSSTLSGQLKGLLDLRDGNNGNYTTIKNYDPSYYDSSSGTLTVDLSELRNMTDLPVSGGVLRCTDKNSQIREVSYSSYTIDYTDPDNPVAVFKLSYDENNVNEKDSLDRFFSSTMDGGSITIGETCDYKGIPYYLSRLNTLVRTFASAMNFGTKLNGDALYGVTGHVDGYNLDGEQGDPPTLFFTYKNADGTYADSASFDINKITCNNFYVNPDLLSMPRLLNASSESTGGVDNNEIILSMMRIFSDNTLFSEGKLQDFINGVTSELAIDLKQAKNFENSYDSVTQQIDYQRMSVSSVDTNEEMIDMVKYNAQYQACAKLLNIIDGIYDTLINRVGLT